MNRLLSALALVPLLCLPVMAGTNYNVCFNSLDVDLDGVMSKSEFMVAFSGGDMAEFEVADTNGDNGVDHNEWEKYKGSRGFEENH